MRCVIVDTSSIIFASSNNVDVFESMHERMPGYRMVVSRGVIRELQKISKSRRKNGRDARIGLLMLEKHEVEIMKESGPVDNWVLNESVHRNCMVCTNDTRLRRRLRSKGIDAFSVTRSGSFR